MQLAIRIIAVSFLAVVLLSAMAGFFRIHAMYDEFTMQQQADTEHIATGMRELLREAYRKDGEAGLERLLGPSGMARRFGVESRWVWFDDATAPMTRPQLPAANWPSPKELRAVCTVATDSHGDRVLLTYVPISLDGPRAWRT